MYMSIEDNEGFITLDGMDGSGKSTQTKKLASYFRSHKKKVFETTEPTKTTIFGKMFRENLKSKQYNNIIDAFLISSDRVLHCNEIKNHLKKGEIVISDRYVFSTIAYQSLTYG